MEGGAPVNQNPDKPVQIKKKVGILGGTFNPPHYGHLYLAQSVLEELDLEQVVFLPSGNPPHKKPGADVTAAFHRVNMTEAAIAGNKHFALESMEADAFPAYSYAYRTMLKLTEQHPENDYYLIMGEDTFRTFARWKNAELIAKLCHIVIGSRNRDGEKETRDLSIRYRQMFGGDYIRVWFPVAEVSSSEIRKRIAEGRKADHLLPHGVMEYIKVNRLYAGKISMPSARSMMFYGLQGERL